MIAANESSTPSLSLRAAKRAKRKQEKKERKRKAVTDYLADASSNSGKRAKAKVENETESDAATLIGGKASRARLARQDDETTVAIYNSEEVVSKEWEQHRPQGGAPILSQVLPKHAKIVEFLESKEEEMRIGGRGVGMKERMVVEVDCHGSMDTDITASYSTKCNDREYIGNELCDFSRLNLRGNFSFGSFSSLSILRESSSLSTILHLDLSRNELWDISSDALKPLSSSLITLDISRNWFESIPQSIGTLKELKQLKMSHNLLNSDATKSLRVETLASMKQLEMIDLRWNQKCGKESLLEQLRSSLGEKVKLNMPVTAPPGTRDRVGETPAVRDAKLLRSQLEPWSTTALTRRLMADFGENLTEDGKSWAGEDVSRGDVMERLLSMYQEEVKDKDSNLCNEDDNGRAVVYVSGVLVEESLRSRVLQALEEFWSTTSLTGERPGIRAKNYMILCSPAMFESGGKKAAKAMYKLKKHQALWDLAYEAVNSVDPSFASQFTAVAVTHNFVGSPHIDKQNIGPFYGFSVGDFAEGTGHLMVECSARVVAAVNTKNRMARVDGRFPHWVGPYDSKSSRYSLIFYRTQGTPEPIGPSVFAVPSTTCARRMEE
ncbi:hypothetical protein ACHAXR_011110 [Thalassiosira sp. AJA248-18]